MSEWQERLAEAMEARGITGGELARRSGFTPQYVNSLRSKDRGSRLPLDTARRLAQALGVSVDWLTAGSGPRDRGSDTYPVYTDAAPESSARTDRYPSRGEAIALLSTTVEPEVIGALRVAVPPDSERDPGLQFWIERATEFAEELRRIKANPRLTQEPPAPKPSRRAR